MFSVGIYSYTSLTKLNTVIVFVHGWILGDLLSHSAGIQHNWCWIWKHKELKQISYSDVIMPLFYCVGSGSYKASNKVVLEVKFFAHSYKSSTGFTVIHIQTLSKTRRVKFAWIDWLSLLLWFMKIHFSAVMWPPPDLTSATAKANNKNIHLLGPGEGVAVWASVVRTEAQKIRATTQTEALLTPDIVRPVEATDCMEVPSRQTNVSEDWGVKEEAGPHKEVTSSTPDAGVMKQLQSETSYREYNVFREARKCPFLIIVFY